MTSRPTSHSYHTQARTRNLLSTPTQNSSEKSGLSTERTKFGSFSKYPVSAAEAKKALARPRTEVGLSRTLGTGKKGRLDRIKELAQPKNPKNPSPAESSTHQGCACQRSSSSHSDGCPEQ